VLIGDQDALDVAAKFGMDSPAFPFTVFTDRRGEVVTLFIGEPAQAAGRFHPFQGFRSQPGPRAAPRSSPQHCRRPQEAGRETGRISASGDVRRRSLPFHFNFWLLSRTFVRRLKRELIFRWPDFTAEWSESEFAGTASRPVYGTARCKTSETRLRS